MILLTVAGFVVVIAVVPAAVLMIGLPWLLKFYSWYFDWVMYSPPKNVGRL